MPVTMSFSSVSARSLPALTALTATVEMTRRGHGPALAAAGAHARGAIAAPGPTWRRVAAQPVRGGAPVGSWLLAVAGQFVIATGAALLLGADLGAVGWDVLHAGIAGLSGLSIGHAGLLTALVCLAVGALAGWRPTAMVVVAALVGAVSVDAVAGALPVAHGLWRWAMAMTGSIVLAAGAGTYLAAGVGESAHDVPLALIRRSGLPLGAAALGVTALTTGLGLVLGGPVGPASPVIAAVLTGVVPKVVRRVERHVQSWVPVVEVTELPVV